MAEPLNINKVRHYLEFPDGRFEIAEPTKFDAANFVLEQEDKRYGRDVSFASGSVSLSFNPGVLVRGLDHQFDRLIRELKNNGFNADVKYILHIYGEDYVIGQLDYKDHKTDYITYFDCKVIQENNQATVKRRADVKVNLFADETLDGEAIDPLEPEDLLIQATPIEKTSNWEATGDYEDTLLVDSIQYAITPFPQVVDFDVENTNTPLSGAHALTDTDDVAQKYIIEAIDNLTGNTLEISNFTYDLNGAGSNEVDIYWEVGQTFQGLGGSNENGTVNLNNEDSNVSVSIDIPNIRRGEKLWFYIIVLNYGTSAISITSGDLSFSSTQTAFSSVVKAIPLYDAMQYVVKSISGLPIDAPEFAWNGRLKKQYITKGILARGVIDQPFNLSFNDILKYLPEVNGDYQVNPDSVFIGTYPEFYKDNLLAEFTAPTNVEFNTTFNNRYAINTIDWKWKKYENQNDQDKSREGVHTKVQYLLPNSGVENTKKVNVGFVRDPYLLEKVRKDAIRVTDETATEQDGDIFIIDTIEKVLSLTETFSLQHIVTDPGNVLKILNDGSINFELLGIVPAQFITISGENAGDYLVGELEPTFMELTAVGLSDPQWSGYELTDISYTTQAAQLTNRTNENFTQVTGLSSPNGIANMRFTPKRCLLNYYSEYMGSALHFSEADTKVTEFINNEDLITAYSGEPFTLIEGGPTPRYYFSAIATKKVTPFLIEFQVICDFTKFWKLRNDLREQKGYIRIMGTTGEVELYPTRLDYNWAENLLTGVGEEKYTVDTGGPPMPPTNDNNPYPDLVFYSRCDNSVEDQTGNHSPTSTAITYGTSGVVAGTHFAEFTGNTSEIVVPNSPLITFGDGVNDSQFSIGGMFYVKSATNGENLFVKGGPIGTNRELRCFYKDGNWVVQIWDDSANAKIQAEFPRNLNSWRWIVINYIGSGDANGITVLDNDVDVTINRTSTGVYTAMEDTGEDLTFGKDPGGTSYTFDGDMDALFVSNKVLSIQDSIDRRAELLAGNELL